MTVTVNGQCWELPDGSALADVLSRLGTPARGVAVALDGAVVPRAFWAGTALRDGASIDVVTAVQGG
jgi:sulfur carrier protein